MIFEIETKEKEYWWDENSGYGSHIEPLQFIFKYINPKNILEAGTGFYSTPFFIDQQAQVTSIEMQDESWAEKVINKYKKCTNWEYYVKISEHLPQQVMESNFDFVLSDGAASTRPAIINHFMERGTETLVAHDTESSWYGWHHVRKDLGYYKHDFKYKAPYTTVWTKNSELIEALKELEAPKEKSIFFMQSFGIGDIIFCQRIANDFIKMGYNVIWGVEKQFLSIAKHFPSVLFIDKAESGIDYNRKDIHEVENTIVFPLRWSDSLCKVQYTYCMKSKYIFFGKAWQSWRDIEVVRDKDNEARLFLEVIGRENIDSEYTLIWDTFTSNSVPSGIQLPSGINVSLKEGYSIFDWSLIIENATYIHAVASSNIYLFELLNLKAKEVHIYKRPTEKNHDNYSYILTKNYILHE